MNLEFTSNHTSKNDKIICENNSALKSCSSETKSVKNISKKKRSANELFQRYIGFVVSLFIIAFGTSLSIRANLGCSPISCPPYVLSLVDGAWSMGKLVICMHIIFIIIQILVLRKNYNPIQLLQIVVSFLFGFYTDLTMWLTEPFIIEANSFSTYCIRFLELLLGGAILAYGITFEVKCDVLIMAGEALPLSIAKRIKGDFSRVKIITDSSLVLIAINLCSFSFTLGIWKW